MKYTTAIQTADGTLFEDEREARRHAQKRYDNHMSRLRVLLTEHLGSMKEAGKAMVWIEENFDSIAQAAELRKDLTFEEAKE